MNYTKFSTESINLREKTEDVLSFSKLIELICNSDYYEEVLQRFNEDGEEFYIQMNNLKRAFDAVKRWSQKYEYKFSKLSSKDVETYFVSVPDDSIDATLGDMIFVLPHFDETDGKAIKCRAIYSAKDQYYEELKLSTHINFLKSNLLVDELRKLNDIWKNHEIFKKKRKFRLLRSKDDFYFLRSVTSEGYQEYGTAFTFVYTILLLNEISIKDKGTIFTIESLDVNESKISMTVSAGEKKELENIGLIKASLNMINNDLRNGSFKLVSNITFIPQIKNGYNLSINVPRKTNVNQVSINVDHSTTIKTLNEKFTNVRNQFMSLDEFEADYYQILNSKKPEGLRSAIEQKIIASPLLRGLDDLRDLFTPAKSGVIDNMAKLINLCGKADALEIDFDLKSKLREIIAEVLFTKK